MNKKSYERPAVIHSEKLEARATACAKADVSCTGGTTPAGPIQS